MLREPPKAVRSTQVHSKNTMAYLIIAFISFTLGFLYAALLAATSKEEPKCH